MPADAQPHEAQADLWVLSLEGEVDLRQATQLGLDASELQRASRLVFADRRARFIRGCALRRQVLARYLGLAPAALRFVRGDHGKPALWGGDGPHFNVSHSGALMLMVVASGTEVGVDVEPLRALPDAALLRDRYFHPDEREQAGDGDAGLLMLWTCKEAAVKAMGAGISAGWDHVRLRQVQTGRGRAEVAGQACHLHVLAPAPGHVAAVASLGQPLRLCVRDERIESL